MCADARAGALAGCAHPRPVRIDVLAPAPRPAVGAVHRNLREENNAKLNETGSKHKQRPPARERDDGGDRPGRSRVGRLACSFAEPQLGVSADSHPRAFRVRTHVTFPPNRVPITPSPVFSNSMFCAFVKSPENESLNRSTTPWPKAAMFAVAGGFMLHTSSDGGGGGGALGPPPLPERPHSCGKIAWSRSHQRRNPGWKRQVSWR